jgi:hypothetical protein
MQFKVSSFVVPVKVKEGRLFDAEGQEQAGLFVYAEGVIYLSGALPRRRRLHVLLHELRHAWHDYIGTPRDGEDEVNNVASFTADCMRQLRAQGGEEMLMRLNPDGVADTSGPASEGLLLPASRMGAECCGCGGSFPASHVVNEAARFDDLLAARTITRRLWCDHCSTLQEWTEIATEGGLPTSVVIKPPTRLRGEAAQTFLEKHGHLYGCLVS